MAYWQVPARAFGKAISPKFYSAQWAALEGKTFADLWNKVKLNLDKTAVQTQLVWVGAPGRDSIRRPYFYNSFYAVLFVPTCLIWLSARIFSRDPRQRKAAQVTAAAYGQGGQNVAAVPK